MSLLPTFVERHHQTDVRTKEEVVKRRDAGHALEQIAVFTASLPGGYWSAKTVGRWFKRWTERLTRALATFWTWVLRWFPHHSLPRERGSPWRSLFAWWQLVQQSNPTNILPGSILQLLLKQELSARMAG